MLITVVDFGLVSADGAQDDPSLDISRDRLADEITVVALDVPPRLMLADETAVG